MSHQTLVCPWDKELLRRVRGRAVVIKLTGTSELEEAGRWAGEQGLQVACFRVRTPQPLSAVELRAEWTWPIALYPSGLGPVRAFLSRIPLLRKLNLRVFLPSDGAATCRELRIIASLGFACAIELRGQVDWEQLADLMTYSLLGVVPHGAVSPFQEVAELYRPDQRTDFGRVYFDDPALYLHLDGAGRVAASAAELEAGRFLTDDLAALSTLDSVPAYRKRLEQWRDVFLQPDGCGWCPGWRVCLARFPGAKGCQEFFTELMTVVERYQAVESNRKTVWRP